MNSTTRIPSLTLLYCLTLLLLPVSGILAQWSDEDGSVYIGHAHGRSWDILPDGNEGAWVVRQIGEVFLQRVDGDGYTQFPFPGILVGPEGGNGLLGAAVSDSGSIIVVYMSSSLDIDHWTINAQRYRLNGSEVWDTLDIQLIPPSINVAQLLSYNLSVTTDGSGGAWVLYGGRDAGDFRICGVTAEGSLKPRGISMAQDASGNMCFKSDGNGGAHLVFAGDGTRYQHLLANGDIQYENGSIQVNRWTISNGSYYSILPQNDTSFYFSFSANLPIIQKVMNDSTLPFGIEGIVGYTQNINSSGAAGNLIEFRDSSVAMTVSRDGLPEGGDPSLDCITLMRINTDGTPYFNTLESVIDTSNTYYNNELPVLIPVGNDEFISFHLSAHRQNQDFYKQVHAVKIDSLAQNSWGEVLVVCSTLDEDRVLGGPLKAIRAANSAILCAAKGNGVFQLWLYKVHKTGFVAGRDENSVDETVLPKNFAVGTAYPNPFNSVITVPFALPERSELQVRLYNVLGQVKMEQTQNFRAGNQRFVLDLDQLGNDLVTGMYFLQIEALGQTFTQKIIYLK
ncbi:T9SS type A sorting domain-containing protein [bacterium]|nr:T9SS type A sorting domain-containing protein [bacterium]